MGKRGRQWLDQPAALMRIGHAGAKRHAPG
jgi:hypothetical protein